MIGFILLPGFTLLSYSILTDMLLRQTSTDGGACPGLSWEVSGQDETIRSQCGVEIAATATLEAVAGFDYLIVIGGREPRPIAGRGRLIDCLRKAEARGATLGGVGSGLLLMIDAGFFDDTDCASSWYEGSDRDIRFAGVRERPGLDFVAAERRLSCAGAIAAMELGAFLIGGGRAPDGHSEGEISSSGSGPFGRSAAARVDGDVCIRATSPGIDLRVRRTIALIEENLETPWTVGAMAKTVGLSKRQLERLFHLAVGCSIQHYSRVLRVTYGLWLLAQTDWPITEIALEAGFSDSSHFNRLFRAAFGKVPSDIRRGGFSDASIPPRWHGLFRRKLAAGEKAGGERGEAGMPVASGTIIAHASRPSGGMRFDPQQRSALCQAGNDRSQFPPAEPVFATRF